MSSTQIDYARIALLNRTSQEFMAANPVLLAGQAAVADVGSRSPSLRFGDGVRPWSALPSFNALGAPGEGGAATVLTPPVVIPAGPPGTISLTVQGAPNNVATQIIGGAGSHALDVQGADQSAPGWFYASLRPLAGTTPRAGTSNGLGVSAGTNADDSALLVQNAAAGQTFLRIRGDGSGYLGPNVSNAMYWDASGVFGVRGTAQFPAPRVEQLADVRFTNLQAGHVLEFNGTDWTNVLQSSGTVTLINVGTGLVSDAGGMITTAGSLALADTAVTPGHYTGAEITVDAQGRITAAASPETLHLTTLTLAQNPTADMDAATKDYVDTAIASIPPPPPPEEGITALAQLTDVSFTDVQDGQVVAYDTASSRWRNRTMPTPAIWTLAGTTGMTTPTGNQVLAWNGGTFGQTGAWQPTTLTFADLSGGPAQIVGSGAANAAELGIQNTDNGGGRWRIGDGIGLPNGTFTLFNSNNGSAPFQIGPRGSGFLGPPGMGGLSWDDNARYVFYTPAAGGAAVAINGWSGSAVLSVRLSTYTNNPMFNVFLTEGGGGKVQLQFSGTNIPAAASLAFGGTDVLNFAWPGSWIGIPTLNSGTSIGTLGVDNGNRIIFISSTRALKANIRNLTRQKALNVVRQLQAVTFNSRCECESNTTDFYGLIAEDVAEIDPGLVSLDKDGNPRGVLYDRVLLMLLPLMQELLGMDEPEGELTWQS